MQTGGRIIHPSAAVGINYAQIVHPNSIVHGQAHPAAIHYSQQLQQQQQQQQSFHPGHLQEQYIDPHLIQQHQQHLIDQQHHLEHLKQQQYLDQGHRFDQQPYIDPLHQQDYILDHRLDQQQQQQHLYQSHHHPPHQLAPGGYETGSLDDPVIIGSTSTGPGQRQFIGGEVGVGYPSVQSLQPRRIYPSSGTGLGMSELEEQECKIINEFCHLLEKSKQLFNGLR